MEDWNELLGNVFVNFLSGYPQNRMLLKRGMTGTSTGNWKMGNGERAREI